VRAPHAGIFLEGKVRTGVDASWGRGVRLRCYLDSFMERVVFLVEGGCLISWKVASILGRMDGSGVGRKRRGATGGKGIKRGLLLPLLCTGRNDHKPRGQTDRVFGVWPMIAACLRLTRGFQKDQKVDLLDCCGEFTVCWASAFRGVEFVVAVARRLLFHLWFHTKSSTPCCYLTGRLESFPFNDFFFSLIKICNTSSTSSNP
jgi:hypothetical protein